MTGIVPTNAYPCLPSPDAPDAPSYVVIGANADSIYSRMMHAIGRQDLVGSNYQHNHHRVERQAEIEEAISAWTKTRTPEQVEEVLREVGVPCGRVFSVKEVVENPHSQARGLVEDVWVGSEEEGWNVKMSKVTPVLEGCDAKTRWAGPELGQHNYEVLVKELGLKEDELRALQAKGIIGK